MLSQMAFVIFFPKSNWLLAQPVTLKGDKEEAATTVTHRCILQLHLPMHCFLAFLAAEELFDGSIGRSKVSRCLAET